MRDVILAERQGNQALVTVDTFNLFNFVVVQTEMFHVWVEADVFNLFDLIVRVVDHL